MKIRAWGFMFFCVVCLPASIRSQKIERHMNAREGDQAYTKGEFQEAEMKYRQANELEKRPGTTYNLGNSLYLQDRYQEAVKQFEDAVIQAEDPNLKARAFHNLGNAHLANQDLENAVRSYIESLKLNPEDMETKKNLTMALQKLQQQQQQQQQQQKDQQDQENQEKKEQRQDEQQPQDQQQQQEQQQQQQQQEAQMQDERRDLSKEEAEELLKIIEDEDQKVQEKLRKTTGDSKKPKKDW